MQLKPGLVISLVAVTCTLSGCAGAGLDNGLAVADQAWPEAQGASARYAEPALESPALIDAQTPAHAIAAYDEVLRGVWPVEAASGASLDPEAIWLAHPTLPVPSFVELTRLDTGRTIVARVVARPGGRQGVVELSYGATRLMGFQSPGNGALRVRRVNPPEEEKSALTRGQIGGARLDTPEFLLVVLRKKAAQLPSIKSYKPVGRAAAQPSAIKAKPASVWEQEGARNPQENLGTYSGYGANFGPGATAYGNRQNIRPTGGWYVQIAALSDGERARQLARATGGQVSTIGSLYRVRKGPYTNEAQARAALGPLAAKGYPDARITR